MKTVKALAFVLPAFLWSSTALSAVIVEQLPPASPGGAASFGNTRFFDDFRLSSSATVKSVTWWAQTVLPVTTGTFEIQFATASSIFPSASAFSSTTVVATAEPVNFETVKFTVTLPTAVTLSANTDYFLSIYRTDGSFAWATTTASGVPGPLFGATLSIARVSGSDQLQGVNLNWSLDDAGASAPAVPEPASWALMIAGIGAVGGMMRRQRRTLSLA